MWEHKYLFPGNPHTEKNAVPVEQEQEKESESAPEDICKVAWTYFDGIHEDYRPFFAGVDVFVEASAGGRQLLWRECNQSTPKISWVSFPTGLMPTIGTSNDMPVTLSFSKVMINKRTVLFYEVTSQVADFRVVDCWFDYHFPKTPRRDLFNFRPRNW